MPNFNAWMGNALPDAPYTVDLDLSYDTARLIADKPTTITIKRPSVTVAAQTVRIEALGVPRDTNGINVSAGSQAVLVLGYKGHPTIADTDLQRGDRFSTGDLVYVVTQVIPDTRNSLQAIGQVSQGT